MNKTPELGFKICTSLSLLNRHSPRRYRTTPLDSMSSLAGLVSNRGLRLSVWFAIVFCTLMAVWPGGARAQSCTDNTQCPATEMCVNGVCACLNESGLLEICASNESCNPGKGCKDLQTDPLNCGFLDMACGPGERCIDGYCYCGQQAYPQPGAQSCGYPESQACCGYPGLCVPEQECDCGTVPCADGQICCTDPTTGNPSCVSAGRDEDNCGSCGNRCGAGQDCSNGSCVCEAGAADCDGDPGTGCETALSMDVRNCGACGVACQAGEICDKGECRLSCQPGFTECNGECVDVNQNTSHCGGCNVPCPPGRVCNGWGSCELTCQVGLTQCDLWGSGWPGGYKCVDLDTDRDHCGGCNVKCPDGKVCDGDGRCVLTCQGGLNDCGGVCRDFNTDRDHCGGCGVQCGLGEVCDGAQCVLTCQGELSKCDDVCRDLSTDLRHCGTCGNECLVGEICVSGGCALVGISALDAAPDLFIPYWSTLQEDTQLILSSTEDATVQAAFFDAKGAIIKAELFELLADELVSVDLSDLGLKGEGSIVVRSKSASGEETNIAAETIIRGGKKEALFSFSPANARKGVWTSFAQAWYGSYGSLDEDELLIFSPAGDLASTLASLGILPGRPANRYPEDLVVEIYDDLGNEINAVTIPVGSLTRMRLREIAGQAYSGPGTLRITPVLVSPGGVPTPIPRPPEPEDVVFITYLKRHVFDEMKVSKDALKSGYLFSEELGKR